MKKVLIAPVVLILVTIILVKFFATSPDQELIKPQTTSTNSEKPSPIPSPSIKPIEVGESTKLKELNSSLSPEDFSPDYKELKESI